MSYRRKRLKVKRNISAEFKGCNIVNHSFSVKAHSIKILLRQCYLNVLSIWLPTVSALSCHVCHQASDDGTTLLQNSCSSMTSPNIAGVKTWNGFIRATTSCMWSISRSAGLYMFSTLLSQSCSLLQDCCGSQRRGVVPEVSRSRLQELQVLKYVFELPHSLGPMICLWRNKQCLFSSSRFPTSTANLCQLHHRTGLFDSKLASSAKVQISSGSHVMFADRTKRTRCT